MKNLVILAFLLIPSVSFAAPLNVDQATSLISVVQSSPTTPASAFTNLITAFSSISAIQAESLINVVQKAPGVPANAFVDMLLAFTVDPAQTVPTPTLGATQTPQPATQQPTQPVIPTPTTPQPAPVVQSVPMTIPEVAWISIDNGILHISTLDQIDLSKTALPTGVTLGQVYDNDKPTLVNRNGKVTRDGHGYGVKLEGLPAEYTPIDITLTSLDGGQITKSVVVRL